MAEKKETKAKEKEVMQPFEYLAAIQAEIKIGKDAYNGFGKYNYRNIEQMLTVIKPICRAHGCCLHITAKPEPIGPYMYVHSIATLHTPGGDISSDGYAREQQTKKGMDEAQITGSCNSYASKYAVQNLFGIDDGKGDPDTMDNRDSGTGTQNAQADAAAIFRKMSNTNKDALISSIRTKMQAAGMTEAQICGLSKRGAASIEDMDISQLQGCLAWLDGRQS